MDQKIHQKKIVVAFLFLHHFPGNRKHQRVEIQAVRLLPDGLHVFRTGGAGIMYLAGNQDRRIQPFRRRKTQMISCHESTSLLFKRELRVLGYDTGIPDHDAEQTGL